MKKYKKIMISLLIVVFFLMGCADSSKNTTKNTELKIVTSMFPMYEITKEVVGDRANISVMVNPNEDAHHYEPSAQAVASVNEADIFIYSSDEMEFWVESLLAVVENKDLRVIELGEGINFSFESLEEEDEPHENHNHEEGTHDGHDHGSLDPHFWLNPVAVANQLDLILTAVIDKDPEGEAAYKKKAAEFSNELLKLDEAYRLAFQHADNRTFVVQHQAFGHLANQYDLTQTAIGGLTTEVEPNPKQLASIVDFIIKEDITIIYYQSGQHSTIAETVANETDTEIGMLYDLENPAAEFSDADRPYLKAMYENLEQLKKSIH